MSCAANKPNTRPMNCFTQLSLVTSLASILSISSCSEKPTVEDLQKFTATESYPEDVFLDTVSNKRALIIVAHDDDDCAMSGTIARLTAKGWDIRQLSFTQHLVPGKGINAASIICQGNESILNGGQYRIGLDTMKAPYLPISYEEIDKQFHTEKVSLAIVEKVNDFLPSVIFTLDDVKGGYGHPEHVFISRLVLDLFQNGQLPNQRIYQSVFTPHMEKEIVYTWLGERLKKWGYPNASTLANELYGVEGMPEPDVQVNIREQAQTKMAYLRAYPEDVRKNLRKFLPYYEEFDAETYFSIFDREFFRVIEK
ncbi:MAG TPA: hypothetical protein DCG19_09315 [Cryomorphaceae bacterium]|nr:hypothetical protein [Owenweeksia sp.]HAD97593.1 hypothetical protein [Cryomorphaceae bacterium]HBF22018.1 hypothetical protein [Cryomorphaceae bacterium]HCQ14709.1 hypothetical protein [Cryomorphaceae bacterium]